MMDTRRDKKTERIVAGNLVSALYPPIIRNALFQHQKFLDYFGFQIDISVTLAGTDVSVFRKNLHRAVAAIFRDPDASLNIIDKNSRVWQVNITDKERGIVTLSSDDATIKLPGLWMLMPESEDRLRELQKAAVENGLRKSKLDEWNSLLLKRPAVDDEVHVLFNDLMDTVVHVAEKVEREFEKQEGIVRDFVPLRIGFYENLIGKRTPDSSAETFLDVEFPEFLNDHKDLPVTEVISNALLACWHAKAAEAISKLECDYDDLVELIEKTAASDCLWARAGLAEVCLNRLPNEPNLSDHIWNLIAPLVSDGEHDHSFKLLSAMCMFIDSELATSRMFAAHPPYYRRFAAFSHACLIQRVFTQLAAESPKFVDWCNEMAEQFITRSSAKFYFQNLCDMRTEPRWSPDYISGSSLRQELLSRLHGAAIKVQDHITDAELKAKLVGDGIDSLRQSFKDTGVFIPGPLEGGAQIKSTFTAELLELALEQLNKTPIDANSFIATVNLSFEFQPDLELAELVADKLEAAQYFLRSFVNDGAVAGFVDGIAFLAAKTRSKNLASALKKFVARMSSFGAMPLEKKHLVRSGLIAAAAHEDVFEWSCYLSEWMMPIVYGELSKSEAEELSNIIQLILDHVPVANSQLAPAASALNAFTRC